jgi:cytochrome c biogenesis protein CcmG, thiol:disulfide interchange protein DsbE
MTTTESTTEPRPSRRRVKILVLLPLVVFAALAVLFFLRLGAGDPGRLPSALIGKAAPTTDLVPVDGLLVDGKPQPGLVAADFKGRVTLVNVWASWCVPCRDEAPVLMKLAADKRFRLVGLNYKDQAENARRFIGRYGNPYVATGADQSGRAGIEWGVYGVPESFVVDATGTITYKLVGPLTFENLETVVRPQLERAMKAGS